MSATAKTPATSAPRPRMVIANVLAGALQKPLRILVYGVDGIGKTTFAAASEAPVFIGPEDGTAALDVKRFPEPRSWVDIMDALDELATAEHNFKTVVIDTLDWLEPLCWAHVIGTGKRTRAGKPIASINDFDYGNGYAAALDEWRLFCGKLERLREQRGMQAILIAHAWIRPFKNPEGEDYDRFEIKLHAKAGGLLREWADIVLFATHETYTHETARGVKGISTGARILWTERRAAFDAKNRYALPEALPLDWGSLKEAIGNGQPATPDTLRARIAALLDRAEPAAELRERVNTAVAKAGEDGAVLARIANKLTAQLTLKAKQQEQQETP